MKKLITPSIGTTNLCKYRPRHTEATEAGFNLESDQKYMSDSSLMDSHNGIANICHTKHITNPVSLPPHNCINTKHGLVYIIMIVKMPESKFKPNIKPSPPK